MASSESAKRKESNMQFVVSKQNLQKELGFVQGVVEKKNTIPVLSNILIESVGENTIRFTGTDLDVTIRCDMDAEDISTPGSICVQARKLFEIARSQFKNRNDRSRTRTVTVVVQSGIWPLEQLESQISSFVFLASSRLGNRPKSPFARLEFLHRLSQIDSREVRPHAPSEVKLRVRAFP